MGVMARVATEWVVMEDMAWAAMEDMARVAMEVALGTLTPSLPMALPLPTVLTLLASLKMASRYLLMANNLLNLFRMAKRNSRRSKHLLDISLSNSLLTPSILSILSAMSTLNNPHIPSHPSIGTMATLGPMFMLHSPLTSLLLSSPKCCRWTTCLVVHGLLVDVEWIFRLPCKI